MENNKTTEAGSNPIGGALAGQTMNGSGGANPDSSTIPNPKLGMAPLSSELAVAAAPNNVSAEDPQPSDQPSPDPLQSADPQNTRTTAPPMVDISQPDTAAADSPRASAIPPELQQAPQGNDPPSFPPAIATLLPDPAPADGPMEPSHIPDPNLIPPDPLTADPPISVDLPPPNPDSAPKESS